MRSGIERGKIYRTLNLKAAVDAIMESRNCSTNTSLNNQAISAGGGPNV